MPLTNQLLMIEPVRFGFNAATAVNNVFQKNSSEPLQEKALQEFSDFVALLRLNGIAVTVVRDTETPHTPDSIFPNNWISFHENGTVNLYPMFARNRRLERKTTVLDAIHAQFEVVTVYDLCHYESNQLFLEGTGSMVLDRHHRLAYACLSSRTSKEVLGIFCELNGYRPVVFTAADEKGIPIYHTNVLLCVADEYVVICMDSVAPGDRPVLAATIAATGKAIISISQEQLNRFAGNMLQLKNASGEKLLVMSSQAWGSLTNDQRTQLQSYNRILHAPLNTIETAGGGSARCMMAEIFLAVKLEISNKKLEM